MIKAGEQITDADGKLSLQEIAAIFEVDPAMMGEPVAIGGRMAEDEARQIMSVIADMGGRDKDAD